MVGNAIVEKHRCVPIRLTVRTRSGKQKFAFNLSALRQIDNATKTGSIANLEHVTRDRTSAVSKWNVFGHLWSCDVSTKMLVGNLLLEGTSHE